MTNPTDNELSAAVARVEGWQQLCTDAGGWRWVHPGCPPEFNLYALPHEPPAYATDAALWGPLIVKYKLTVNPYGDGWAAFQSFHPSFCEGAGIGVAVCLAVLAAQEGR